ncbi:MAG: hypothetical protein II653_02025 [Lachnospiraceae bacterium]|nr:hypothetical protein [Lachnospiraceae bacterium]MBQ5474600.1 hypothetical protein [Lachnospiraceae bacterium]
MEKSKNKLLLVIFACAAIFMLVTGIMDLTNKKDVKNEKALFAVEVVEVEHRVGGFIPLGKDHYYLAANEDGAFLITTSKSWYEKNFNSDGYSKKETGVNVKGLAKDISDYETRNKIESEIQENIGEVSFIISEKKAIDVYYKLGILLKFVFIFLVLIVGGILVKFPDIKNDAPAVIRVIFIVAALGALLIIVNVL